MSNHIRSAHKVSRNPLNAGSALLQQNVVIIFENKSARQHALQTVPELIAEDTKAKGKFNASWSFDQLSEKTHADKAAVQAAAADLVVFAISMSGDLPGHVKLWIETWVANRKAREGALVCLASQQHKNPDYLASLQEIYLRHTARRAGMDFLSKIPSGPGKGLPDSPDSCRERARHVGPVLDEILTATLDTQFICRL